MLRVELSDALCVLSRLLLLLLLLLDIVALLACSLLASDTARVEVPAVAS